MDEQISIFVNNVLVSSVAIFFSAKLFHSNSCSLVPIDVLPPPPPPPKKKPPNEGKMPQK